MMSDVIREQIAYYRARAGEYDEWFYRVGRYDRGEAHNARWFHEVEAVMTALRGVGTVGRALELAAGTGNFTQVLATMADAVVAVDASTEVMMINQQKLQQGHVSYVQADLFTWEPEATYDLVFMSFWLSHVPPDKLDGFLSKVRRAMKVGGQVFMVDSLRDPSQTSSAVDHAGYDPESIYHTRKLNDGQHYRIVKVFYDARLVETLARHGIQARYETSGDYFWWAQGTTASF